MGDRHRNRPYYDRNQGQSDYRDDESRFRERGRSDYRDRDWDSPREFSPRHGEHDASGYPGPFGWTQDPAVDRDFSSGRRYEGGSDHRGYRGRDDDRETRYGFDARDYRSPYGRSYGADYSRGLPPRGYEQRDWNRGGSQQDWNRGGGQQDSGRGGGQHDWSRGGRDESYFGYSGDRDRDRDERGFGQQLREAGQRIARKVKGVFRGPKGYKRSDERIREDVNDRLSEQQHFDPSEIEVSVSNCEVTLTGSVLTRGEKFLAEEIADDVNGVSEVHNQLRVRREQTAPSTGGAGAQSSESATTGGAQSLTESSRNRNSRAL